MYYPFLRGKQNELLAIRELSSTVLRNSEKISPILEPVKMSSTIKTTLNELVRNNVNFNIVVNPREGSLVGEYLQIIDLCSTSLVNYSNYQVAIILDSKTDLKNIIGALIKSKCTNKISLIHNSKSDDINSIIQYLEGELFEVVNNIINLDNIREKYFNQFDQSTIVTLRDGFDAKTRNSDYKDVGESDFSEDHIDFVNDNLKGYSDFLTLGDRYVEGGFSPYAVAIHISYTKNNKIRVQHFVSDSNSDNTNIAGKYSEALDKLIQWEGINKLNTIAMKKYKVYFNDNHFPGLGVLKKLSIMNHIEIVSRLF